MSKRPRLQPIRISLVDGASVPVFFVHAECQRADITIPFQQVYARLYGLSAGLARLGRSDQAQWQRVVDTQWSRACDELCARLDSASGAPDAYLIVPSARPAVAGGLVAAAVQLWPNAVDISSKLTKVGSLGSLASAAAVTAALQFDNAGLTEVKLVYVLDDYIGRGHTLHGVCEVVHENLPFAKLAAGAPGVSSGFGCA